MTQTDPQPARDAAAVARLKHLVAKYGQACGDAAYYTQPEKADAARGCAWGLFAQIVAELERAGERERALEEALNMADDVLVEFVNLRVPDNAHPLGWSHPYDGQLVVRADRAITRSRSVMQDGLAAEGGRGGSVDAE